MDVSTNPSRGGRRSTIVLGAVALLLVGSLGGAALARPNPDKARPFEAAQTFYVTDVPELPTEEEQWTSVRWPKVGMARLGSDCAAAYDPATGAWGVGVKALTVENTGPRPIYVLWPNDPTDPFARTTATLAPGESEAFFAVGQVTNSDDITEPSGSVGTFAIVDDGGTSVTGTIAWFGRWEPADNTGRCTFSLQMKG
jgi:hypothetical protein